MSITAFIVTWVLFGLLAGAIGAARNVGFWLHAIIGFLFGPVGVLTALLFKPSVDEKFNKEGKSSGLVKCPFCAEIVKAEARICKHCHSNLTEALGERTDTSSKVETELYRLFQIRTYSGLYEVDGNKFTTIDEAKAWIDDQRRPKL